MRVESSSEKASLAAIEKYQGCMRPILERAKTSAGLDGVQLIQLVESCPHELNEVTERLLARADYRNDDLQFRNLSFERKAAMIKREFREWAVCELRDCGPLS